MNTYKHGIRTNEVRNLAKAPSERGKKIQTNKLDDFYKKIEIMINKDQQPSSKIILQLIKPASKKARENNYLLAMIYVVR